MNKILAIAVSHALCNVASDVPMPSHAGNVSAGLDYKAKGKSDGATIAQALRAGQATARQILTEVAGEIHAMAENTQKWLDGYAEGLSTDFMPSTVKVMKSQAKSVIESYAIGSFTFSEGEGDAVVQTTKTGKEWLLEHKGSFQEWLSKARVIAKGESQRTPAVMPKRVTEKGEKKITNAVTVMTPNQASDIAEKATAKAGAEHAPAIMNKAVEMIVAHEIEWEARLFQQAEDMMQQIEENSKNPRFKSLAGEISTSLGNLLTELASEKLAAHKLAQQAKTETEGQTYQTPEQPAQQVAAG